MITGFNTDIEYEGVTYHVQTEDKGLETPLILSLVYDGGTILASKRSPYDDLLGNGFDEKALSERLQKQHTLICAAVRAGRIEDLKRMTMKESASKQKNLVAQKEVKQVPERKEISLETQPAKRKQSVSAPQFVNENANGKKAAPEIAEAIIEEQFPLAIPKPVGDTFWNEPEATGELIISEVEIIEEEAILLPADAVEIITDFAKTEKPKENKLKIELLNEAKFKGGERKTISILVHRGVAEEGLNGAHVLVKVLGSAFRPLIFHAKTDSNGIAVVHLQLPNFIAGRAALLIRAMSEGEETELRRVITQG